ncbi:MAG: bifunctional precorrin-2 dehydrogenase/sirohydrochlorin ferrochelatase [Planctomycetota bacterium]
METPRGQDDQAARAEQTDPSAPAEPAPVATPPPRLPVMLRLTGRPCVVVGAGATGRRRAQSLIDAGAQVRLIDPDASALVKAPPACETQARPFAPADAEGAALVVAATDNPQVNHAVAQAARQAGALVNRVDAPELGDVTFPATRRLGPATVCVDSGGASAAAARVLVEQALGAIDPAWIGLLHAAVQQRTRIQNKLPPGPARQRALAGLADEGALRALQSGGPDALANHYQSLLNATPDVARISATVERG